MLFLQYPPCSTCQKAKKWLDDHGIEYTARHIKEDNPTADELREWVARSGLPLKRFFNTSGLKYKALELKDKLKLEDAFEKKLAHEQEAADISSSVLHDGRQEAVEALVALGYSSTEAMKAVRKVNDVSPDDVEGLLKAALKLF